MTPAAAAMWSMEVAWKPCSVNILVASSSSCARRCARGILAVVDVDMAAISESVGGGARALEGRDDVPRDPAHSTAAGGCGGGARPSVR